MFIYLSITSKIDIAIVVSIFILVISPILFYFKMFSKIDFTEKFQKIDKSKVIHSGMSSHLKDRITVGGTLFLLNDKLIFQTNMINFIKRHEKTIFLKQIAEVDFKDTLGFIKNGLHITNTNHECDKFIVTKRKIWKEKIEKQMIKLN
jgi:hypothetical protein